LEANSFSDIVNLILILSVKFNSLKALNVSSLVNLTELSCDSNKLTTLNVSGLVNLTVTL
jgi:hypothetical protein